MSVAPAIAAGYHEAAHAVIAHRLGLTVKSISIAEDGSGRTKTGWHQVYNPEREILVSMAGAAAEVVLLGGRDNDCCDSDWDWVAEDAEVLPPTARVSRLRHLWDRTTSLVKHHRTAIEDLAGHLLLSRPHSLELIRKDIPMLSTEFLQGFRGALGAYGHPQGGDPQGAYDEAPKTASALRKLSKDDVDRLRLAIDAEIDERRKAGTETTAAHNEQEGLPQRGDQNEGPLLPEAVVKLLKSKLTEEEYASICEELKRAAQGDQEKQEQEPPSQDESEQLTSASRPNRFSPAMDAALRVRSDTPGQVTYADGRPAHGTFGGIRYQYGRRCDTQAEPGESPSSRTFAERFPQIARIRSL